MTRQKKKDSDVASSVKNVISAFGSTLPETTARESHKNVKAGGTDPTPTPNPNPTPDVKNQENITLEIGGTDTRTQENVNNQNNTDNI